MSDCPTTNRLRSLLDGALPETEQSELQQHIDSCERCQQTLEGLVAGKESWDGLARRLGDGETPVTPALHEAINAAKDLEATIPSVKLPPGLLQPSEQPDSLGRLAHYEILQEVGSGGMGIVLKAFDTSLRRIVAIKVMAPHLAANSAARRRFVREAQAAAAVAHEHVVAIHAVADQHESPYLAMQFIEGKTLQERLDKVGPLSVREVLRIGMQTAAAHAQGLVHRDIKPANILLENGVERVKLTDFGLARAVDDASVTQSGVIAGTPLFMSPEQARGEAVDHRSDLFSLGSVMYAMCVGHAPFRASTTMGVIKRVCDDLPRPIREVNPDVPDWLTEIIAKLLAKAPADRFQTSAEVADLLGRFLAHLQQPFVVPRPEGVPTAVGLSPTTTTDTDDEPASETRSSMFSAGVIAFFVGMVPLFAAGQVSAYPELAPPGISPRAFAALVACWCFIPAIQWWRESRRPKPWDASLSSGGVPQSATGTQLAAASPRQVPFLFSLWSAFWLAAFLFLPIAGLSLSGAFSPHDTRVTLAAAIFVWLALIAVGGFLNGIRRRAAAAGIPLADLAPGWRIRCTKCDRSKPLGEVGGIRLGAKSRGKWTLAWCSQCRGLRWAAIERGESNDVPASSKPEAATPHEPLSHRRIPGAFAMGLVGGLLTIGWIVQRTSHPIPGMIGDWLEHLCEAGLFLLALLLLLTGVFVGGNHGLRTSPRRVRSMIQGLGFAAVCLVLFLFLTDNLASRWKGWLSECSITFRSSRPEDRDLYFLIQADRSEGDFQFHAIGGEPVGGTVSRLSPGDVYLMVKRANRVVHSELLRLYPGQHFAYQAFPSLLDFEKLQGRWRIVQGTGAVAISSDAGGGNEPWLEFDEERLRVGGAAQSLALFRNELKFAISPTSPLRNFDLLGYAKGVYKLDGDRLTIWLAEPGQPRPRTNPADGVTTIECQRMKQ